VNLLDQLFSYQFTNSDGWEVEKVIDLSMVCSLDIWRDSDGVAKLWIGWESRIELIDDRECAAAFVESWMRYQSTRPRL
jgi:hypothetical protein